MSCEGCALPEAALQCPTCKKLDLPPSFFCTQTCFKEHWADHKLKHTQSARPTIPTMTTAVLNSFNFTGPLRPGRITPRRVVPKHIPRPDYADRPDGASEAEEKDRSRKAKIYNISDLHDDSQAGSDIQRMKTVCRLSREVLDIATAAARPGVTTDEIDRIVHDATVERNMYPSPLNYYNFPKSVCTSVNEVICHGIPDSRELEAGDILNIDVSCYLSGFHGDLNETIFIGKPDADSLRLVHCAYECLCAGIDVVKPDALYKDVGDAIEDCASRYDCSVVRTYTGHGVGHLFHTAPTVCHYANNKSVGMMRPGHIFTIEPMINLGTWKDVTWPDDWTSTTKDGKRSAQFEHTMVVTNEGVELLTDWNDGIPTYQKQLQEWGIELPTPLHPASQK